MDLIIRNLTIYQDISSYFEYHQHHQNENLAEDAHGLNQHHSTS